MKPRHYQRVDCVEEGSHRRVVCSRVRGAARNGHLDLVQGDQDHERKKHCARCTAPYQFSMPGECSDIVVGARSRGRRLGTMAATASVQPKCLL